MIYNQKPNFIDLGMSSIMGPQLRAMVEAQLLNDLANYTDIKEPLKFDWSNSCIEGHDTRFLDGELENFSAIALYNTKDQLMIDGWMEFVQEGNFLLVYWDFISLWQNNTEIVKKSVLGIPDHIWEQIPDDIKWNYEKERLKPNE